MEGDARGITLEHHHLPPLKWPTISLGVEVHSSPNWPLRARRPPHAEILQSSRDSSVGIDGVLAPTPVAHALILAAHAWSHDPLGFLRDLVDVAAVSSEVDERELDRTAEAWGIGKVWRTTRGAVQALFYDGRETLPLRLWARHLETVRERTVLETHLAQLVQSFWGLPARQAALETAAAIEHLVKPVHGERWQDKLRRARFALSERRVPAKRRGERGSG